MLRYLSIRQFAIVEALEIEFAAGMSVLSGETGAGKSILIDALGLLLGDRADSSNVREGAQRAEISAEFDLQDAPLARQWLQAHELDDESGGQCLIRRSIGSDGRGRATVNGTVVTVRDLKDLGESLLGIHGQHAHQSLLKTTEQRDLLDDHGGHGSLRDKVEQICMAYRNAREALQALSGSGEEHRQRLDYLQYQIRELEALGLGDSELQELEQEHKGLANAGRLLDDGQRSLDMLYGDEPGTAYDLLSQAGQRLGALIELRPELSEVAETVESSRIQVQEAAATLRNQLESMDLDPARLEWVDARLAAIHDLARKHQIAPTELSDHLQALQQEQSQLENAGNEVERLEQELTRLKAAYSEAATALHEARQQTAGKLADKIQATVRELGIPEAIFEIAVEAINDEDLHSHGNDRIEFRICANPGQTAGPLSKVASGGELSRISLAIQVITADSTQIPSLIFDEVDTGIGGRVAEIVGRQLRTLGQNRQTLCVTHLPQVAAQASQQFYVSKEIIDGQTHTRVQLLDESARVNELARMLGGVEITDQTRAHAQEMLLQSVG